MLLVALAVLIASCGGGGDTKSAESSTTNPDEASTTNPDESPTTNPDESSTTNPDESSTTTKTQEEPGGEVVDPGSVFVPTAGYEFVEVPEIEAALRTELESNPDAQKCVAGFAARSVMKGGEDVAFAMTMALKPEVAAVPETRDACIEDLSEQGVAEPQPLNLAGETVQYFDDMDGRRGILWMKGPLMVLGSGIDRAELEAIVSVLIEANK